MIAASTVSKGTWVSMPTWASTVSTVTWAQ